MLPVKTHFIVVTTDEAVCMLCGRLVFSQSLLSLDLIEDFLALKTEQANSTDQNATDSVIFLLYNCMKVHTRDKRHNKKN